MTHVVLALQDTFFTFVIAIIVVVARIIAAANKAGGNAPPPPGARPSKPTETEEERMRRFMEAVGRVQGDQTPPQPVRPKPGQVQQPMMPVRPPVSMRMPSGKLRRATSAPSQPMPPARTLPKLVVSAPPPTQPAPVTAPAFPPEALPASPEPALPRSPARLEAPAPAAPIAPFALDLLVARLRDPEALRQAVVLREILGPPKALVEIAEGGIARIGA